MGRGDSDGRLEFQTGTSGEFRPLTTPETYFQSFFPFVVDALFAESRWIYGLDFVECVYVRYQKQS